MTRWLVTVEHQLEAPNELEARVFAHAIAKHAATYQGSAVYRIVRTVERDPLAPSIAAAGGHELERGAGAAELEPLPRAPESRSPLAARLVELAHVDEAPRASARLQPHESA